ncbi:asparagine synthase-related protein [Mesorhizobium sp. M0166]|uniref:asparagine synthase-related protein n=1 Tax=Mesorhizobium sp. M0166 TaxID=2956902 RepID=UPI003339EC3A
MARSIELRSPFLDCRVVELAVCCAALLNTREASSPAEPVKRLLRRRLCELHPLTVLRMCCVADEKRATPYSGIFLRPASEWHRRTRS